MNTQKIYDDFYALLENGEEIVVNRELFIKLQNYIQARLHDLVGVNIPIHFYFKDEVKVERNGVTYYVPIRINPITREVCKEPWKGSDRAFYNSKGVFADFSITNNYHNVELKGFNKIDHLIDFAFTVEHELKHVLQFQNIEKGILSYNNFKMIKNIIALSFIQNQEDELSKYFYFNAHNDLFLELDANRQAESFVGEQIRNRGLGNVIAENNGNRIYNVENILNGRIKEAHVGRGDVTYIINMIFGFNNSMKQVKVCDNPEKIVELLVDGLIRQNPKGYLNRYPILKYLYNSDGTKKTYYEIMNTDNIDNELSFYNQIIEEDTLLKIQKLEYNMSERYSNTTDINIRNKILDEGLSEISKLIESENIDIENILVYLDKRLNEIEKSERTNKSASKLILIMTKQTILKRSMIKSAYIKTAMCKEELLKYQELLKNKCNIDFSATDLKEKLDNLITILEYDHINKIYSSKGYTKEEINELIIAAKRYQKILNKTGYILSDNASLNEKSYSVLPGYDNLYHSNYYKSIVANNNLEEKALLKDEFELINQLYIESQNNIGSTGHNKENSAVVFLGKNPIIEKIINDNPNVLEILYKIREMEDNTNYLTRLDATIIQCESYISNNKKGK